jgi:hypothetical protein
LKYDIKKKQIEIGDHLRLRGDPSVGHYSNDIPGSRGVAGNPVVVDVEEVDEAEVLQPLQHEQQQQQQQQQRQQQ